MKILSILWVAKIFSQTCEVMNIHYTFFHFFVKVHYNKVWNKSLSSFHFSFSLRFTANFSSTKLGESLIVLECLWLYFLVLHSRFIRSSFEVRLAIRRTWRKLLRHFTKRAKKCSWEVCHNLAWNGKSINNLLRCNIPREMSRISIK